MSNKPAKAVNDTEATGVMRDRFLWLSVVIIFAAGLYGNYAYFGDVSIYLRVTGWIVLIGILLGLSAVTIKGKQALEFLKAARTELRKVSWPTRQETIQMTAIIVIAVVIVALVLWGVDSLFMKAVGSLTGQRG